VLRVAKLTRASIAFEQTLAAGGRAV